MEFEKLKCVSENVQLDDYLQLYKYVRDNMNNPEWLGTFEKEEIIDILSNGGKIWLYYDNNKTVCSMFYFPANNKSLLKHNIQYDENIVGSLGPIMVSPDYVGNGFQTRMMLQLEEYCKNIGKKYIFTKAHSENLFSINNMIKNKYELVHKYKNERGDMLAFLKEI